MARMSMLALCMAALALLSGAPRALAKGAARAPELGSVIVVPQRARTTLGADSYRWGGVYGHIWWVDPVRRLTGGAPPARCVAVWRLR